MQIVSKPYIEQMSRPFRNNGYIKGTIGIINLEAQSSATVDNTENNLAYWSDKHSPFIGTGVTKIYATAEQDFAKVDGSMYFLPKDNQGFSYYNNGFVTSELLGSVVISFTTGATYDIKGLTIDFGKYYPTKFVITNGKVSYEYENKSQLFTTENVFDSSQYIKITPTEMVNGQSRLRINKVELGVVDSFTNDEVISCSISEYVSATTESLPSKDVEIIINNQDSYYNPDNVESAIGYLELGQEVRMQFGYQLDSGEIEWLPPTLSYLKEWNANDSQAQFVCTDLFASMEGIYYNGLYREKGISLYDLAVDVLQDAGYSEDQYYLDPYLRTVTVYNSVPAVKHSEALQIIANAGRCALYDDRDGRIHIQSSFVPDITATSNGEADYSKVGNVMLDTKKVSYADASMDFSVVDGSILFLPKSGGYVSNTGYASSEISDANGNFANNPKVILSLETGYTIYGLRIEFHQTHPEEIKITTYYQDSKIVEMVESVDSLVYETGDRFDTFDRMEIEITKGYPNSRVFIDKISVGKSTDYTITRDYLTDSPTVLMQDKLRNMTIIRNLYSKPTVTSEVVSETLTISPTNTMHTVYLSDPAYDFSTQITLNGGGTTSITGTIVASSNYYVTIQFKNVTTTTKIDLKVLGKEYILKTNKYSVQHNDNGSDIEWDNPLISTVEQAQDMEEWLSSYYLGRVEYQFAWRGDPRTDANDLFYFQTKDGKTRTIRAYENDISFDGAWSGKIKARAVELE